MTLETVRYMGRTWYVCPVRGCTCIMPENGPEVTARGGPTHFCADFDCWGRAWVVDGCVERVQASPPNRAARGRRALRAVEGD